MTSAARIAVVDYGAGNLVSIGQALATVGAEVVLVREGEELRDVDGLIVPGVGAAEPAMARLDRRRLRSPILEWIAADRPFLGICLGLQLLFERSEEDGATTLGVLPGSTVQLERAPTLPHIGWNQVVRRRPHPLLDGIEDGADLYFVHSYVGAPTPGADDLVVAETEHGSVFPSVVARGRLAGVQFHPERSGTDGLRLLANFVAIAADVTAMRGGQPAQGAAGAGSPSPTTSPIPPTSDTAPAGGSQASTGSAA